MQVAGIKVTYDLRAQSARGSSRPEVAGKPLDESRSYTVATNSFLALGGDLYTTFPRARTVQDGTMLLVDAVFAWLGSHGPVKPPALTRYRVQR